MTLRHLRHQVGGRGRHHDQIAVAGETDVAGVELARGIEQIHVAALVRQRAGGQRRDELLRGLGEHAADANAAFLQPPDQVQRLVGGDTAADDQGDAGEAAESLAVGARLHCRALGGGLRRACGERGVVL